MFPRLGITVVNTESIRLCPIVSAIFPGSQPHSYTSHYTVRPLLWRTHGLWAEMVGHLSGREEVVMEMSCGGWVEIGHATWGLGDRPGEPDQIFEPEQSVWLELKESYAYPAVLTNEIPEPASSHFTGVSWELNEGGSVKMPAAEQAQLRQVCLILQAAKRGAPRRHPMHWQVWEWGKTAMGRRFMLWL